MHDAEHFLDSSPQFNQTAIHGRRLILAARPKTSPNRSRPCFHHGKDLSQTAPRGHPAAPNGFTMVTKGIPSEVFSWSTQTASEIFDQPNSWYQASSAGRQKSTRKFTPHCS